MPSNLPLQYYFDTQAQWKSAMMELLDAQRFTHAITLSWNDRSVGLEQARENLKELLKRIDEDFLGSRYHRYPSHRRTQAVFCFEGLGAGKEIHAHSAWRAPEGKWLSLCRKFPPKRSGIWDTIVPKGSHALKLANPTGRNPEVTGYVLKQQHKNSNVFEMIWADEFHPVR